MRVISIFGGGKRQITGKTNGGSLWTVFGSSDLDLRDAAIADSGATFSIICLLGSVRISVPENWALSLQTGSILGAVESKCRAPASPVGELTLTGLCFLGSVEVHH